MKLLITGGCSFSQVQGQPDPYLDEDKKVQIDHIVDSCVSLLFYPKTLKPPGCFKNIFRKN